MYRSSCLSSWPLFRLCSPFTCLISVIWFINSVFEFISNPSRLSHWTVFSSLGSFFLFSSIVHSCRLWFSAMSQWTVERLEWFWHFTTCNKLKFIFGYLKIFLRCFLVDCQSTKSEEVTSLCQHSFDYQNPSVYLCSSKEPFPWMCFLDDVFIFICLSIPVANSRFFKEDPRYTHRYLHDYCPHS